MENFLKSPLFGKAMVIIAHAIVEIAGSPKDFVDNTMKLVLDKIKEEEGIKLLSKTKHKAKKYEKVFSTFSELSLEFQNITALIDFCFRYLPSHLEIEEPGNITLRREDLADMMNELLLRLHKSDMIVKDANARLKLVEDANRVLVKNAIAMALQNGPSTVEQISQSTGIKLDRLPTILDYYIKKGLILQEGKLYMLRK